jgi:hypothetical protein
VTERTSNVANCLSRQINRRCPRSERQKAATTKEDHHEAHRNGIVALGLSLSALTLGSKAASAAEPCAPAPAVQPAGYYYGGGYSGGGYQGPRAGIRYREHLRWEREQARLRWAREHRYNRGY